jgi:hypothetical protein
MNADWESLERDIVAIKTRIGSLRARSHELDGHDIERLLSALRACATEFISLRSTLEKAARVKTETRPETKR